MHELDLNQFRRGDRHPTDPWLRFWGRGKGRNWVSLGEYWRRDLREFHYRAKADPEKVRARNKRNRLRRREETAEYNRQRASEYYHANKHKPKFKARQRAYYHEKLKHDPMFKLRSRVRERMREAFRRTSARKSARTTKLLGCSWDEFVAHMESQFLPGMAWHNRGEWHIDHIIPLASANTEARLCELFHYTNLRPLWARDNLSKGAKLTTNHSNANSI